MIRDIVIMDEQPDFKKPDLDRWARIEQACQVIVHHGRQYQVVGISEPDERGTMSATLIPWKPF